MFLYVEQIDERVTSQHIIGQMMVRDFGLERGWDIGLGQDLIGLHLTPLLIIRQVEGGGIQAFHMLKLGGGKLWVREKRSSPPRYAGELYFIPYNTKYYNKYISLSRF